MNHRIVALICCGLLASVVCADERDPSEKAAARLAASTVTVRILPEKGYNAKRSEVAAAKAQLDASDGVTVCSGVSVAPGQIVTFASSNTTPTLVNSRVRVTLPDGEQSQAHLRVVDNYSGLSLLDIEERSLPVLEIAKDRPKVGSRIMSAAAGGIEGPTVSTGIVAGLNRSIGAAILPPLIQCDIRTAETSGGAAIVDKDAKLVGILAVTPAPGDAGGWAYAVTAQHVKRLIDARQNDKLLVLERRPATLGLTMGPSAKEDSVSVEQVEPGGPAERAGIKQGDIVLEAEGAKVRSAYQVVGMVLNRQAGEKFNLVVQRGNDQKAVEMTLGSSLTRGNNYQNMNRAPRNELQLQQQQESRVNGVPQQLRAYSEGKRQVNLLPRNGSYDVITNSVNVDQQAANAPVPAAPPLAQPAGDINQLRIQVTELERTVRELREELQRANGDRAVPGQAGTRSRPYSSTAPAAAAAPAPTKPTDSKAKK